MHKQTEPVKAFIALQNELNHLKIQLRIVPGGYRVAPVAGLEADAVYTDDMTEAGKVGRDMAADLGDGLPPMGPTGRRNSRRGLMYRHNAMLCAMRRKSGGAL